MRNDPAARTWERRTRRLQGAINAAAGIDAAAPWLFGAAALVGLGLYGARRGGWSASWVVVAAVALGLAVVGTVAWQGRARWFGRGEARALLEFSLGLESRLTAAAGGVGAWPEPARGRGGRVLRWRPWAAGAWVSGAMVLLVAGQRAPLPAGEVRITDDAQPPALTEAAALVAAARALEVAEPAALEALERRAEELAARAAAERFSHAGLEAADALRAQVGDGLSGLSGALTTAAQALDHLTADGALASPAERAAALAALDAALAELRAGAVPLSALLAEGLPAEALAAAQLTPEQARALAQQLAARGQAMRGVAGAAVGRVPIAGEGGELGRGEFSWLSRPGVGSGGVERGPGAAPLTLAALAGEALDGQLEATRGSPHATPALGDLVRVSREAPPPDAGADAASAPVTAGAITSPAQGGEAVWVDRLTPEERAAVRAFFH